MSRDFLSFCRVSGRFTMQGYSVKKGVTNKFLRVKTNIISIIN